LATFNVSIREAKEMRVTVTLQQLIREHPNAFPYSTLNFHHVTSPGHEFQEKVTSYASADPYSAARSVQILQSTPTPPLSLVQRLEGFTAIRIQVLGFQRVYLLIGIVDIANDEQKRVFAAEKSLWDAISFYFMFLCYFLVVVVGGVGVVSHTSTFLARRSSTSCAWIWSHSGQSS
jgi:hypothetical protein